MKTGNRKFLGFLITVVLYTVVVLVGVFKSNSILDISVFAMQCALGYATIAGLFFGSNVMEHFAAKSKGND